MTFDTVSVYRAEFSPATVLTANYSCTDFPFFTRCFGFFAGTASLGSTMVFKYLYFCPIKHVFKLLIKMRIDADFFLSLFSHLGSE